MESSAAGPPPKPDEESAGRESRQPSDMWAVLPEQLRSVTVATEFVSERHRWNTNEEVASLLVAFDKHQQWLQKEVIIRPPSGTLLFYSKQNQRYRKDGYFWKKRRDGKTTREDHMKLKVSGVECIYGCYVHSAILPTFHRRSYWLLQNPDIVLVHYLNLPLSEETPLPPLTIQPHKQQWEEGQLLAQLRPMFARNGKDSNNSVSEEMIQSIASTLLDNQRRVECPGGSSLCKTRAPPTQTVTYLSQKIAQDSRGDKHRLAHPNVLINSPCSTGNKAPLILNLSQLQGNNSLIILSSSGRGARPMTIIGQKAGGDQKSNVLASNQLLQQGLAQRDSNPHPAVGRGSDLAQGASQKSNVLTGNQFITQQALPHRDLNAGAQVGRVGMQPLQRPENSNTQHTAISNGRGVITPVNPRNGDNTSQFGVSVPHLSQTTSRVAGQPPQMTLVSTADFTVSQPVYNHIGVNGTTSAVTVNGVYGSPHQQASTAAISCSDISNPVQALVSDHHHLTNGDQMTYSGCYGNSFLAGDVGSVYTNQSSSAHVENYVNQNSNHEASSQTNNLSNGQLAGNHMTSNAIAQVAESDMVVDSLIREMNLQQHQQQGSMDTMQISPTHSDLNLDDLDLSFLDSVPSPAAAASVATYSSPAVTMVTTPSPLNGKKTETSSPTGIVEFCPDWAYKEGGEKVLIIGPWYSEKASFAVLFDGMAVPAELLQGGVLRCICPEHKPGKVKVEVVSDGHVISNPVQFEYRSRLICEESKSHPDWFSVKELQLQTWLLQRLQLLEKTIDPDTSASLSAAVVTAPRREVAENLELRLVECVQRLSEKTWPAEMRLLPASTRGLSLLHLAAALGYSSLINCLIGWRREHQTSVLMEEVDPVATDDYQATPLVWACALGHQEAASVLYQYNASSLTLCTCQGQSAIDVAKHGGHMAIASKLSALEKIRLKTPSPGRGTRENGGIPDSQGLKKGNMDPQGLLNEENLDNPQVYKVGSLDLQGFNGECLDSQGYKTAELNSRGFASKHLDNVDSQGFKVPASPLHSTPKSGSKSHTMDALSVSIPPDLQPMTSAKSRRSELMKRLSVEVLPNYPNKLDQPDTHQVRARSLTLEERKDSPQHSHGLWGPDTFKSEPLDNLHQGRARSLTLEEAGDPGMSVWDSEIRNDPMLSMNSRDLNSPIMFMAVDANTAGLTLEDLHQHTAMETESSCHSTSCSSQADRDDLFDSASQEPSGEGSQGNNNQMATLANQIIAAMPERIKLSPSRSDEHPPEECVQSTTRRDRSSSYGSFSSCSSSAEPPCAEDSGISTPLEGIAEDYRYVELATPPSSVSPSSSLHSPYMDHFSLDSPPPTAEEFNEYFNAPQTYLEKDFSQLTLSDAEQRNLYAAAKIIQNFYRRYKDRKEQQMLQRQREVEAVVLIQSYYRRYKQYRYYKKMTQAAVLIQSQFRSYYAQKRYRQRREAATLIQNRYRAYKEQKRFRKRKDAAVLIQQRFRNHYHRKYQKNQKSGPADGGSDSSQKVLLSGSREATPSSSSARTDKARGSSGSRTQDVR